MTVNKAKIIFMGTPEFAVPTMETLYDNFGLEAVVTIPDRKQGRGQLVKHSAVKEKALKLHLPVLQPESLKDGFFIEQIKAYKPDIICVVAFRILPREVYELANIASFNIHGSLLPKYRGAAPINWAIIRGETKTGVTSFILQDKVDTGNILLKREMDITSDMTAGDLHDLLMIESSQLAYDTVETLLSGRFSPLEQNDDEACSAPKIFKEDCKIDFNKTNIECRNFIHGLSPHPAAWCLLSGKRLILLRAKISNSNKQLSSGEYIINDDKFVIGCSLGNLEILELKPEGKKAMKVKDYLRGFRDNLNGKLT